MSPASGHFRVILVRHAETEWSVNGRHTGRTDIPLTDVGRARARALQPALARWNLAAVMTSPLIRARETCELAGLGDRAVDDPDLMEWDYGDYEGITTHEIHETRPDWNLWTDGCPGGENAGEVAARVDRVIAKCRSVGGNVALFAHGHVLRVLGARWLTLGPERGELLALSTGSISVLGYEHETTAVLWGWNDAAAARAAVD